MIDLKHIHRGAEVIGADGVHIGIVDHVDGDRLKLTRKDSVDNRHHKSLFRFDRTDQNGKTGSDSNI